MTTMSKPIIIGAAVPALLLMGAGCGESEKKCSQRTSKAQCGKDCQWTPTNATSHCKQNNTLFDQFFNFSEAADFFYNKHKEKTVTELEEDVDVLIVKRDDMVKAGKQDHDYFEIVDEIEFVQWHITQKLVSAVNQTSEKVFHRCEQADGEWRRQYEDAQNNPTALYPIPYQRFVDQIEFYKGKLLSFRSFLPEDGAIPRDYMRTSGYAKMEKGKIVLVQGKPEDEHKAEHKDDGKTEHVVEDAKDFERFGVVLEAMSDKCHANGGLVSVSKLGGGAACFTLPKYLENESHSDSIDKAHHCEEANKRAQNVLYPKDALWKGGSDWNGVKAINGGIAKPSEAPPLFQWEDGKCVVSRPCELVLEPLEKIKQNLHPVYRYCKAKLDRKTEETNVQCMGGTLSRKDAECVVDNKRKICGYYGTQSPDHLEIGAGICQLVNSNAADSPGRCSDIVKKAKDNKAASDSDKKKKQDKGRV